MTLDQAWREAEAALPEGWIVAGVELCGTDTDATARVPCHSVGTMAAQRQELRHPRWLRRHTHRRPP